MPQGNDRHLHSGQNLLNRCGGQLPRLMSGECREGSYSARRRAGPDQLQLAGLLQSRKPGLPPIPASVASLSGDSKLLGTLLRSMA